MTTLLCGPEPATSGAAPAPDASRTGPGGPGLRLNPGDPARVVTEGRVELYYAEADDDRYGGRRRFLVELRPGDLLPSLGDAAAALGAVFYAVSPGARLRSLAAGALDNGGPPGPGTERDGLVAAWVDRLAGRLTGDRPAIGAVPLPVGEVVTLPTVGAARPATPLAWVQGVTGTCRLNGRDDLTVRTGEIVPVSSGLWLEATDAGTIVRTLSTEEVAARGGAEAALAAFSHRLLETILADDRQAAAAERERLRHGTERDARALAEACGLLSRVFERGARGSARGSLSGSPLVAACRIAGGAVGLRIAVPADHGGGGARLRDPVEAIARASHARVRPVTLAGEWWTRDHGPLVAFRTDGEPVALLRRARRGYVLHDPTSGAVTPLTSAAAQALRPRAYMFLPSFGSHRLTLTALWRAGRRGAGADLFGILLLSAAVALLAMAAPFLSQILFDTVVPQADRPQVPVVGAILVVSALTAAALGLVRGLLQLRLEAAMELNLEAALMDRLLRLPAAFFREYLTGDLAQRIMGISSIRRALTGTMLTGLVSGVFSLASLGLVVYYDRKLAVLGGGLALIAAGGVFAGSLIVLRHNRALAARAGRIAGLVLQLLWGISKLRTAGAERRAFAVWARQFAEQKREEFRVGAVGNHFAVFMAAYPMLTTMAFFAAVAFSTGADGAAAVSTGAFVAVMAAFGQLLAGLLGLGGSLISVLQVVPQYERLAPILTRRPEADPKRVDPGPLAGDIEVTGLSFRYPGGKGLVLNDVSLRARPGELVALVGPSGSGKSTVLRLLLGFEQPETGAVAFDGRDLAGLDLDAVRRQCGVVLQHGRLMQGDVLSNIVGPWNLSVDHAWAAARLVGLEKDIEALPMGMYTLVSEDGGTFSGGQRQRLLLARAIVHQPAVLLLDEATSALDNRTQAVVSHSLAGLRVTRLVIAHRLSTIRDADRIYVLDRGRVVESGTYASLLEADGAFAALAARQLA